MGIDTSILGMYTWSMSNKIKNDIDNAIKGLDALVFIGRRCGGLPDDASDARCLASGLSLATGGRFDVLYMADDFLEDGNAHTMAAILRALGEHGATKVKGNIVTIELPHAIRDTVVVNG